MIGYNRRRWWTTYDIAVAAVVVAFTLGSAYGVAVVYSRLWADALRRGDCVVLP